MRAESGLRAPAPEPSTPEHTASATMSGELALLTHLEEPVSSFTHLGAGLLLISTAGPLLRRAGRAEVETAAAARARAARRRLLSVWAYLVCVGGMFLASGFYHLAGPTHPWRELLWHLDHGSIWVALAATFTPLQVLACPWRWARRMLVVTWSIATAGLVLEVLNLRELPMWVSPLLYVGMGWVGFPTLLQLARLHGWRRHAGALLVGGLLATCGGVMDSLDRPSLLPGLVGAHELMHALTVIGGALFWHAIWELAGEPASEAPARVVAPEVRQLAGRCG